MVFFFLLVGGAGRSSAVFVFGGGGAVTAMCVATVQVGADEDVKGVKWGGGRELDTILK